jgi:tetratricopeptide (TPR) repeat protein
MRNRACPVALAVVAVAVVSFCPRAVCAEPADDLLAQARQAFKQRAKTAQARAAVDLYEKAIGAGGPFEALVEGAEAAYFLGEYPLGKAGRAERLAVFDKGIAWAKRAVAEHPERAEAHYWHGTLVGVWAAARGILKSLSMADDVRLSAERAIKIDPRVGCGGALRLLGRYYHQLPGMFGGDATKAAEILERQTRICPTNDLGRYYLAEVLHDAGRDAEARPHLEKVIAGPGDPRWLAERPYVVTKAKTLLATLP